MKTVSIVSLLTLLSRSSFAAPSLRERALAYESEDDELLVHSSDDGAPMMRKQDFIHPKFQGRQLLEVQQNVHVLITYKNEIGRSHIHTNVTTLGPEFVSVQMIAGTLPLLRLKELAEDPDIDMIVEDKIVKAAGETVPPGMAATQYIKSDPYFRSGGASCSSPNVFKVGIVDSGMTARHPDSVCHSIGTANTNCIGRTFLRSGLSWDNPENYHGSHVSGIVAAKGGNNQGIVGQINDDNVCIITARVLDDEGYAYTSTMLDGIEWVVAQGSMVVNLSIVGMSYSVSTNRMFEQIYNDRGRLVIAAAGNKGNNAYGYPASFGSVVSVAAVDNELHRAGFSQANNQVDLAAPGEQILSLMPVGRGERVATVTVGGSSYTGKWVERSKMPAAGGLTRKMVYCANRGLNLCPGPGGHICIIKRGGPAIERKAVNCQKNGGVAAIVFNGRPGRLSGKHKLQTKVTIPVALISKDDGKTLVRGFNGQTVKLEAIDGYGYSDGTSMAAPHVAGAAAAVWRSCPQCTNKNVESCLKSTARDLGELGRDNVFGHGLVQTRNALNCLRQAQCC